MFLLFSLTLFAQEEVLDVTFLIEEEVLAVFSGDGNRNTRPFQVEDNWEIQWITNDEYFFNINLRRQDGTLEQVSFASPVSAGAGNSFYPTGGRYYLQIRSNGDWSIRIVQLRND